MHMDIISLIKDHEPATDKNVALNTKRVAIV